METQKIESKLKWYKISGYAVDNRSIAIVAFVEATSRRKVLKYHGGRRRHHGPDGHVVVQFPTNKNDIQLLGKHWSPDRITELNHEAIIEIVPVTRYVCECGLEHVSEFPYRSVWCSCGKKAFPSSTTSLHL
ncbi:hypothetical protein [Alicyclobacillus mengziensis]|uniref:Uncharacterized protein n=1 Tax=Alicyclobacillus mengziensis TaxID=2931921 RepID=A0A9X7VVQ3_9BACL|nr:hypothetical protein [Alicyclobacillus mengziensis]QSO45817.1 hypothetical protein JZ786_14855 [Alicyclobacillus mengziensis]